MDSPISSSEIIYPILQTDKGFIYHWYQEDYIDIIRKKQKKEVEKIEIEKHLHLLYPTAKIEHAENGAPILLNCDYSEISISHNKGFFALYFSKIPIGIDIQTFNKKIQKGMDYFVTEQEKNSLVINDLNLHLIWAAKEAFYKQEKGKIADLKNDVTILEINKSPNLITLIYNNIKTELNYKSLNNFVLVWT